MVEWYGNYFLHFQDIQIHLKFLSSKQVEFGHFAVDLQHFGRQHLNKHWLGLSENCHN